MVPIFSPMTCDGIVTLEKIIFATLWSLGDKNKEKSFFLIEYIFFFVCWDGFQIWHSSDQCRL